jgi:predicted O-methyltransferase YrrM
VLLGRNDDRRLRLTSGRLVDFSTFRTELRYARTLRGLPPRVVWFQLRARREARRLGDLFSLTSALTPRKLRVLLELARGRRTVVELGSATGWTALALALTDPQRTVLSFDPVAYPQRERYLALAGPEVARRIEFVQGPGEEGADRAEAVELLFVDSSHEREPTLRELDAWRPRLAAGALVVLDDYGNPYYPGVREAVEERALAGEAREDLFVWRP